MCMVRTGVPDDVFGSDNVRRAFVVVSTPTSVTEAVDSVDVILFNLSHWRDTNSLVNIVLKIALRLQTYPNV